MKTQLDSFLTTLLVSPIWYDSAKNSAHLFSKDVWTTAKAVSIFLAAKSEFLYFQPSYIYKCRWFRLQNVGFRGHLARASLQFTAAVVNIKDLDSGVFTHLHAQTHKQTVGSFILLSIKAGLECEGLYVLRFCSQNTKIRNCFPLQYWRLCIQTI